MPTRTEPFAGTRTQKLTSLVKTAEVNVQSDPDQAIRLTHQAEAVIKATPENYAHFKNLLVEILHIRGIAQLETNSYNEAISSFLHAVDIAHELNSKKMLADTLMGVGLSYLSMGEYSESLNYLFKSLSEYQELRDKSGQVNVLNNLAYLYQIMEDPSKGLIYANQAFEIAAGISDTLQLAETLYNRCACQNKLGLAEEAHINGQKCIETYRIAGYLLGEVKAYKMLGETQLSSGNIHQAINYFQLSYDTASIINNRVEICSSLRRLGVLKFNLHNQPEGIAMLQQALSLALQSDSLVEIRECHFELSVCYKKSQNFRQALEHYEKYHEFAKKLFDNDADRRQKAIEAIYEVKTAKKDAEIFQLKNIQLQKEIDEKSRIQKELELMATLDPLTGAANRRQFLKLAESAFSQACRYSRPLSTIMLDVDLFKEINDSYGHPAGDAVLFEIANRLQKGLRKVDILGRYGGDEFAILMPETGFEGARRAAERLRTAVAGHPILFNQNNIHVSVSIGVSSTISQSSIDINELIAHADQALYKSKQSGRNQVNIQNFVTK